MVMTVYLTLMKGMQTGLPSALIVLVASKKGDVIVPDMERIFRNLELHVSKDGVEKATTIGYHRGLDRARKEVAVATLVVATLWVTIAVFVV